MLLEDQKQEDFSELRDEEVLALSIDKPALFGLLVDRYQAAFIRKVQKVIGHREEVVDVVQETFTKIYLNASKFKTQEGAQFSSWAYKILLNTTFTHYQKYKRENEKSTKLEAEIWDIIPDFSVESLEKRGIRDVVATVLARMPESLARVLTLYFIEDKPQKEIAEIEGVSVSAVKTRIPRAKREFKKTGFEMKTL